MVLLCQSKSIKKLHVYFERDIDNILKCSGLNNSVITVEKIIYIYCTKEKIKASF